MKVAVAAVKDARIQIRSSAGGPEWIYGSRGNPRSRSHYLGSCETGRTSCLAPSSNRPRRVGVSLFMLVESHNWVG